MNANSINNLLEVKYISPKKGKGVLAKKNIKKGTIVEIAHILLISNEDYDLIQNSILYNYIYEWDDPNNPKYQNAIALSICQFFNHSYNPNVEYQYNYKNTTIKFIAIKDISKGEELTINYNGNVNDKSPVWFEVE
ncbi:MAG: SET domain-containing protein-lysine N-methyltransferase [Promethearchaeota archaeon]